MAIAKKNRRKIIVNDREFYWWVLEEVEATGNSLELNIASEDKKFIIRYYINQEHSVNRYLIIIGKEFTGVKEAGSSWVRIACPKFEEHKIVYPKDIRNIILWCFNRDKEILLVDYKGKPLEFTS